MKQTPRPVKLSMAEKRSATTRAMIRQLQTRTGWSAEDVIARAVAEYRVVYELKAQATSLARFGKFLTLLDRSGSLKNQEIHN